MTDTEVRTVVHSSNRGRWSLDTADGPDLTSGQPVVLMLGGAMIVGRIEGDKDGYYFLAADGSVCGMCTGMRVRRR